MRYTPEDIAKAKAQGRPLFKIEILYRYVKDPSKVIASRQCWGVTDDETAAKLSQIISDQS